MRAAWGRGRGKGGYGKGERGREHGKGGRGKGKGHRQLANGEQRPEGHVTEPSARNETEASEASPRGGRAARNVKLDNTMPDRPDKSRPNWWRRLTEVDPISLEKLSDLRFPPFELGTDEAHETYFDGRMLANYLVSTGSFLHPISRRELTREECERLDEYLRLHRLGNAGVLHAFDHKDEYKNGVSPENQVRQLQEAAAALLHNLYQSSSREVADGRAGGRSGERGSGRRDVRDVEAAEAAPAAIDPRSFEESVALGGAALESTEDFPELGGSGGAASSSAPVGRGVAPLSASWTTAGIAGRRSDCIAHTVAVRPEDFPELRGGAGGDGGNGGASGSLQRQSLLSRWATSNAAAALLCGPSSATRAPAALADSPPAPPPPEAFPALGEAFPSLAGGRGATAATLTRVLRQPKPLHEEFHGLGDAADAVRAGTTGSGGWASRLAATPPVVMALSGSCASVTAPAPRAFAATPEQFPSLGAAATVSRAASATTIPSNRDELIARNKTLMKALAASAHATSTSDVLGQFRTLSGSFQRGEVSSFAYFAQFRELFGEHTARTYFPELVLLLPDQVRERVRTHERMRTHEPHATHAATCQSHCSRQPTTSCMAMPHTHIAGYPPTHASTCRLLLAVPWSHTRLCSARPSARSLQRYLTPTSALSLSALLPRRPYAPLHSASRQWCHLAGSLAAG